MEVSAAMGPSRGDDLPTTAYAVLGLLSFGEMSGYDVLKLAERSIGYFWSPAKSHVYSELKRLAAAGYAEERVVEQDTRPNKRLYRMTPAGEQALKRWLEEAELESEPYKDPFLLKVFFGRFLTPEKLIEQFEGMIEEHERYRAELRAIEEEIKDEDSLFHPYLTLRAGLAHVDAAIKWLEESVAAIRARPREKKEASR
jgi:PadR family transcriptional regulator, regulatory protein AphA